jgi:hypothetical protein
MADEKRGWGWPLLSRKAHYFIGAMSLCRKWMYTGSIFDTDHNSPDNCKACMKIRAANEAKGKNHAAP